MTAIRLPLSGDVTQVFNINVGESSDPDIEKDAICKASYTACSSVGSATC